MVDPFQSILKRWTRDPNPIAKGLDKNTQVVYFKVDYFQEDKRGIFGFR